MNRSGIILQQANIVKFCHQFCLYHTITELFQTHYPIVSTNIVQEQISTIHEVQNHLLQHHTTTSQSHTTHRHTLISLHTYYVSYVGLQVIYSEHHENTNQQHHHQLAPVQPHLTSSLRFSTQLLIDQHYLVRQVRLCLFPTLTIHHLLGRLRVRNSQSKLLIVINLNVPQLHTLLQLLPLKSPLGQHLEPLLLQMVTLPPQQSQHLPSFLKSNQLTNIIKPVLVLVINTSRYVKRQQSLEFYTTRLPLNRKQANLVRMQLLTRRSRLVRLVHQLNVPVLLLGRRKQL